MARKGTFVKLRKLALATLLSLLAVALAGSTAAPVQACNITCPCELCLAQHGVCTQVHCVCGCILPNQT